ncbi:MAG: TetR/AcrR family transcriptional regulator [bacterium]|nr:TetR/AcrR family transcriptional regulator [bacterium]
MARKAILEVARKVALESESYRGISLGHIAKEAKVSKATIYRWWSSKVRLLCEACEVPGHEIPSTGSLRGDLIAVIRQEIKEQMSLASRPVYAGAWAEIVEINSQANTPEEQYECMAGPAKREVLRAIFDAAIVRGEWPGHCNLDGAYLALFSFVFMNCVGRGKPPSEEQVGRLAEWMQIAALPHDPGDRASA